MLDYLKIILPFFVLLIVGIFLIKFLFNFFSKKRKNIWDKELKNILKETEIKTDKSMHKELLLRNSYINSIERLDEYLTKIYKKEKKVFNLTPLDAFMLIELFPFDIRKSQDGKFHLIDKTHFLFFLRLIKNGNHNFISNEKIIELRDKLLNKLLSWEKDNLIIDAKYIFDLILNENIPDDDINNQTFIKLVSSLKEEKKVLFKIEEQLEEKMEENNQKENKLENKKEEKNISILKGKEFDYVIDLDRGIQYQIPKNKEDEKDKKDKTSEFNRIANLLENLTILFASQPEAIKNAFEEVLDEKLKNKNIEELDNKKLFEEIKHSIEKSSLIDADNKSEILNTLQKEIGIVEPEIKIKETFLTEEEKDNKKDHHDNIENEEKLCKDATISSNDTNKNYCDTYDIDANSNNYNTNDDKDDKKEDKNNNANNNLEIKKNLDKEELENELNIMSDESFLEDFGLASKEPDIDLLNKKSNNNEKKKIKNSLEKKNLNNDIGNKLDFLIKEIKEGNFSSLNINTEEIVNEFLAEIFEHSLSSLYFSLKDKKYAIEYCDFIKYFFSKLGEKVENNFYCDDKIFIEKFLEQNTQYFIPSIFEYNSNKILLLKDNFKLKITQLKNLYNKDVKLIKNY